MSDINVPQQMSLPFDIESLSPCAEIFSFALEKERIRSTQAAQKKHTDTAENKILERILARADRLSWY